MIKLNFLNYNFDNEIIKDLEKDLGFECSKEGLNIEIYQTDENSLNVQYTKDCGKITYGGRKSNLFRGISMLIPAIQNKNYNFSVNEKPMFKTNGAMLDVSRNAVLNNKSLKKFLRSMSLMGLNTLMLYTEDTYEIKAYPYFGYMRGRYTKEEIQEIDQYALSLGIELVPCIQTLGHLATYLRWSDTASYKDSQNCLLVGEEQTYNFINEAIKTISECFTSRKIHLGLDETLDLGRGKYLDKNGYKEPNVLYHEHLNKVIEIARNYGFEPMMWSDMIHRYLGRYLKDYKPDYDDRVVFPDEELNTVPKNIRLIYWDYYHQDEEHYSKVLTQHKRVSDNVIFSGGIWCWSGFSLSYSRTVKNTIPALQACKKHGIKDIIATIWHNCAECDLIESLSALQIFAEYDYSGNFDEKTVEKRFSQCCQSSFENIVKTAKIEHEDVTEIPVEISRILFANDPLYGLQDKFIEKLDVINYYKNLQNEVETLSTCNDGFFKPSNDRKLAFIKLLSKKVEFSIALYNAYKKNDKKALAELKNQTDEIIDLLEKARITHYNSWMFYNKSFGWEGLDLKYGTMIMRYKTTKTVLTSYLNGEIEKIEELEGERLWYNNSLKTNKTGSAWAGKFLNVFSPCVK